MGLNDEVKIKRPNAKWLLHNASLLCICARSTAGERTDDSCGAGGGENSVQCLIVNGQRSIVYHPYLHPSVSLRAPRETKYYRGSSV